MQTCFGNGRAALGGHQDKGISMRTSSTRHRYSEAPSKTLDEAPATEGKRRMTEQSTTHTEHVAAAIEYARQVREDWSLPQLQAAVELSRRHSDEPSDEKIARALMRAAADPAVRKPSYVPAARLWNALDRPDVEQPKTHSRTPHECRSCGQPGSATSPPAYCPSCSAPWEPIGPDGSDVRQLGSTTPCPSCRHRQAGRFDYCARCGAAMAYSRPAARPAERHEQQELPLS